MLQIPLFSEIEKQGRGNVDSFRLKILEVNLVKVPFEPFDWIEKNEKFTWSEHTTHGKEWDTKRSIQKKKRAYLNYNYGDKKSYVNLYLSLSGYITVQFDYQVTFENLMDLVKLADQIDCNLWQYKPKRKIVDYEFARKYK